MVKGEFQKRVDITIDDLCKVLVKLSADIEGIDVSVREVEDILLQCLRCARRDPGNFRDVRHDLLSRRLVDGIPIDHPLRIACERYGFRSIIANTAGRMVSIIKLTSAQIARKTKNFIPPAFDTSLPYKGIVPDEYNAYKLLDRWEEIPAIKKIIVTIREIRKEYKSKYYNKKRIILLDNNSSQGYCSGTVNITDLMGNIYYYPPLKDKLTGEDMSFHNLNDLLGIQNSRDEDDPFAYLLKQDQFNGYKFRVVAIPDKDGKIRVIFQGCNDIQTVSKGVHELLDKVARLLDGNYTYNQKDWIVNIIDKYWHKLYHIIGTDMSKYSDTLHRKFILAILEKAGFTEDELRELDMLYSLPVMNLDGKIIGDVYSTLASYQGQYGDFPMITICNLTLQAMVMFLLDEEYGNGKNGAVGDDTGMVFFKYHKNALEIIKYVYGSVGVNINEVKTGQLDQYDHKDGVVDFVKLRFDKDGIIPFIEPKPYFQNDFDQAVRDIYDSIFFTNEQKSDIFRTIFNDDVSDMLMNISIINGGINMRVIEPDDVNELLANRIMLNNLNQIKFGSFYTWLNQAYKELLENGFSWRDTVFSQLRECKVKDRELLKLAADGDITIDEYEQQMDGFIMLQIAKVSEFGSMYEPTDYLKLIGIDPKDIYRAHKNKQKGYTYDGNMNQLYDMIKSSDSMMGRLKKRGINKSKTVYKDKIEIALNGGSDDNWLSIVKRFRNVLVEFDTIQEFHDNIFEVAKTANAYKIVTYLKAEGLIITRHNGAGIHHYIKYQGKQYALFKNRSSTYDRITEEIKNKIPLFDGWDLDDLFERYRSIG